MNCLCLKKNLLILFLLFVPVIFIHADDYGVITGNNVRIRSEASTKSSIAGELFKGMKVKIVEEVKGENILGSEKWYKITHFSFYEEGFVHSKFLALGNEKEAFLKTFNKNQFDNQLKEIFSAKEIKKINEFEALFQNIKTAEDLEKAFRLGKKNMDGLSETLDQYYQKKLSSKKIEEGKLYIGWIIHYLPAHASILVAEGTTLQFTYFLSDFLEKAKTTKDPVDEKIIQLLIDIYGSVEYYSPSWFMMTWDYGGDSLLGSGIHLKLLKEIESLVLSSRLFSQELLEIQKNILTDIQDSLNYHETREAIIKEIKQILGEIKLTSEQKKQLEQRLKDFENPKKELNTNCKDYENSKCSYG
ncbi:MAG TPA: hypothetical protein DHW82_06310 [Spirochaetia bacterium]|nr:MAG: hypothetical protein A2Y41_09135 [Spirochaetes bacterium GWB1_36_13]HCL56606.1 hypothetical protein [Spirochaetia bacterium]